MALAKGATSTLVDDADATDLLLAAAAAASSANSPPSDASSPSQLDVKKVRWLFSPLRLVFIILNADSCPTLVLFRLQPLFIRAYKPLRPP